MQVRVKHVEIFVVSVCAFPMKGQVLQERIMGSSFFVYFAAAPLPAKLQPILPANLTPKATASFPEKQCHNYYTFQY